MDKMDSLFRGNDELLCTHIYELISNYPGVPPPNLFGGVVPKTAWANKFPHGTRMYSKFNGS